MQGGRAGSPTQGAVTEPEKPCISLNDSQIAQQIICNVASSQKDRILGHIVLFAHHFHELIVHANLSVTFKNESKRRSELLRSCIEENIQVVWK